MALCAIDLYFYLTNSETPKKKSGDQARTLNEVNSWLSFLDL